MEVNQHRTWAEIDLGAIEHNYRVICEQVLFREQTKLRLTLAYVVM